jgi:hypothetical protein
MIGDYEMPPGVSLILIELIGANITDPRYSVGLSYVQGSSHMAGCGEFCA